MAKIVYQNGDNPDRRKRRKFSVVDAHRERMRIKEKHGKKNPGLTAYALSILFPEKGRRNDNR